MDAQSLGYQLTDLQRQVIELAKTFDEDSETRYQLLAYSHTRTAWPLSREEVDELPHELRFCGSSVWLREAVRAYLIYLEHLIGLIRGEGTSSLVLPDTIASISGIEYIRSEWLRVWEFREAAEEFVDALKEAFDYFNCQLVVTWMREALSRTQQRDDKPSFCSNMPWSDVVSELQALEDVVFGRARTLYAGRCKRAYQELMRVKGIESSVLSFFNFTQEQLMTMAACNRRCFEVNPDNIVAMDPPTTEPKPAWKETATGLLVPGNME